MLRPRIIPCLDVRDGRVVKGIKFQGIRDAGDPVQCARNYVAQGADELVILDISATLEGRENALDTVRAVRSILPIPLTVGGGVRSIESAVNLMNAGADKVAVNSAAVDRPELIAELNQQLGAQAVVLAIDATRRVDSNTMRWEVVTHGGKDRRGICVVEWAELAVALGAGEILLTSFDRDGTGEGYDLDLLRAVSEAVQVPVIASGGARNAGHFQAALQAGASAVLAASILHDGDTTVDQLKRELSANGVEVRL